MAKLDKEEEAKEQEKDEQEMSEDISETEEKPDEISKADESEADNTKEEAEEEDLEAAPKAFREKIEALEDRVKRQMAEFENFRKRTDKEKTAMFDTGARSVLEKILPVVDNFERGLSSVPEDKKDDAFVDGMNMIYKQLMQELENIGVQPIEALGEVFDPNLHNAVQQVESEEYESGVVAMELQKGYTYHDTVIRHSMVAVVV